MPDTNNNEHRIRAVIYDMDGVIVDSEPLWREAEIRVFEAIGIPLTDAMCRETMGLRIDEVVRHWFERYPGHTGEAAQTEEAVITEMAATLREKAQPMEGVRESLAFFKGKGVPVALASTSSMRIITAVVDALDLREAFVTLHSAEQESYGKPHPGVYLTTAKELGVAPSCCLALEDSINGMIAAKAARMKLIALPDSELAGDKRLGIADVVLPSLAAVDESVWALFAG